MAVHGQQHDAKKVRQTPTVFPTMAGSWVVPGLTAGLILERALAWPAALTKGRYIYEGACVVAATKEQNLSCKNRQGCSPLVTCNQARGSSTEWEQVRLHQLASG